MRKLLTILLFSCLITHLHAQTKRITGKVTDDKGLPIAGASVVAKGTTTGTTTETDGSFALTVPSTTKTLVISALNAEQQEVNVTDQTAVNVSLRSSTANLEDVVVIAYGTQSRVRTTGATARLDGSQFTNQPIASVDAMLQGKAAGLQSVAASGQPGAITQIRIRGIGSINAGAAPLFVIDGIPVVTGNNAQFLNSSNLLAGLNPDDIEDLTVLKDASATSIYGSRAANGVVLITTKTGKSGKAKFNVSSEIGSNDIAYFPDISKPLNKDQYKDMVTEGIFNVGGVQSDVDAILDQLGYNTGANTNWLDLVRRHGAQQQVNVSVSGGNNGSTYYLSGGYFRQQSPVIGSDFKRYNATLKATLKATNKLSFSAGANVTSYSQIGDIESTFFRNPIFAALALRPSQPAFKADGTVEFDDNLFEQIFNPLAITQYDRTEGVTSKILGNADMTYKVLPGLTFKAKYGLDYSVLEELVYYNPFFGDGRPPVDGQFFVSNNRIFNYLFSTTLEYNKKFMNNKLDLNALVGHENQKTLNPIVGSGGSGVPFTTSIRYPSVSIPTTTQPITQTDNSIESYLSRALLSYEDKYNLSLSLRTDGSSRFAPGKKWGTFWSVGGSWNIDREKFFEPVKVFSYLKLRGSYGTSGNNNVNGDYAYQQTYTFNASYAGQAASAPNNVGNPSLTWEKNRSFDVGLEAGLLKNRITMDLGYYRRKTYDLLLNDPLSPTTGFTSFNNNIGSMENKGIELTMNFVPVQTKDFKWDIGFNVAWNRNKILSLSSTGADIVALPYLRRVGQDFQSIYTRLWAGADPATGDPLWYTDGTKSATTNDFTKVTRVIVGSASPKGFGGVNTAFRYKNISLSANFYFQYGNLINDATGFLYTSDGADPNYNQTQKELRRWRKPGDITDIPRYDFNNATVSNAGSTRYFYKGDFIRLRTINLSYDLPKSIMDKWKMTGVTVYVRGNNIWTKTFDPNLTVDPEQPINGATNNQYFIPKSYTVGLNISF